jgi:hypothetical protein
MQGMEFKSLPAGAFDAPNLNQFHLTVGKLEEIESNAFNGSIALRDLTISQTKLKKISETAFAGLRSVRAAKKSAPPTSKRYQS